ncbi:M13 family metallopeptidase [Aeromicrobium sp.]|uniref:M13 family metallopeptidase n=1 Tax=Aeromicrobium sp. TaxID=1871063 RepID=UPI002FC699B4
MTHGIDTTQFDPEIRAQDDLFRYVNGPWLRTEQIKPDRATAGAFVVLVDEAEAKVREIIETASKAPQDEEQRKIGDLYASFMDEARAEELGATPLEPELAQVEAITDIAGFISTLGVLDRQGVASVFGMYIGPDSGNPERYITHLNQGGIGLPDESYYREDATADIRTAYVGHVTTILGLAGLSDAVDRAARIMDLETRLASHHWDRVACRDAQKTYNLVSRVDLQALAPTFDWASWSAGAKVPDPVIAEVVIGQPSFLEGLETLLVESELESWKDWLRWQVVRSGSPYLSSAFVNANFEFYGRTLSGTDELRPRWKRGVGFVEGAMGEAVGRIYVRTEFPPASKERMTELIDNLIEAYRSSITALPWMSDETKKRAHDKLNSFDPKIGHPENFRDYAALETAPDDLLGNARRALAVATDRELAKIGSPIDRDEWYMTPQTVNAYYNPTMNEIVFPAAILQPPFFHAEADDAVNYGAIGAVIGHEIGHGFDDQGSHYDGTGALNNWWTDEDRAAFEQLTSALIAQYDALSPEGAEGKNVNGSLTIGENIGDLGGLGIAYKAFKIAQSDGPDESIDGYTPDQRFFISWAQAWQSKVRPAETVRRLTVDPHSPPEFRCNQVVRNIDAFYDAFGVTAGDAAWLEPEDRVVIW